MKSLYGPLVITVGLLAASIASGEEIVLRLVNVQSGAGEKNCQVNLLGGPGGKPGQLRWLTQGMKTGSDGRARFNITRPLPEFVSTNVDLFDCLQCGALSVTPVDEILRTGVMSGMDGRNRRGELYCRPSFKKLEEISAKPGEIVIFVRRLSFWERLALY